MTDGIDLMTAKRERNKRQPPPRRHPKAAPAPRTALTAAVSADAAPEVEAKESVPASTAEAPPAPAQPEAAPPPSGLLRPAQFYVDPQTDDYLRSARAIAVGRRLDVTGSAIVRLAVHELMQRLSPEEVTERLAAEITDQNGRGRKRR